jgi:hypothetical protein
MWFTGETELNWKPDHQTRDYRPMLDPGGQGWGLIQEPINGGVAVDGRRWLTSSFNLFKSESYATTRHEGAWGKRRYISYSFSTFELEGSGQCHAPAAL